jgi:hypothetical protein
MPSAKETITVAYEGNGYEKEESNTNAISGKIV